MRWSSLGVGLVLVAGGCAVTLVSCGKDEQNQAPTTNGANGKAGEAGAAGEANGAGGEDGEFQCVPALPEGPTDIPEEREVCADKNPLRNAYFGDLHVHTMLSFDAYADDVRLGPEDAYAFARGQSVMVPPLDSQGNGTQPLKLDRPLDFAAVTDHAEFLGEVIMCTTPGSAAYNSEFCTSYRTGGAKAIQMIALPLSFSRPSRSAEVCGEDGQGCVPTSKEGWSRIQKATEAAYDRSSACSFTSLHGYEWTGATGVSNLHRNVIFRDKYVPDYPVSYMEAPSEHQLWDRLECGCPKGLKGCQVLAIPHNSNLSNGKMFQTVYPGAMGETQEAEKAAFRRRMEPLVEIYQHKGTSECVNGLSGILGAPDELCDQEQQRKTAKDCGESVGSLGLVGGGCSASRDFVRGALLSGLQEQKRIGENPFRLGIIASTDTHMGTPGATDEGSWKGHTGFESTPEGRLTNQTQPPSGIQANPGGLVGVWAVENTRHALFDALARRETFGTSGTRIVPRLFGAWSLPADLCSSPTMIQQADTAGVPMGGILGAKPAAATAPVFSLSALRDPAANAAQLQRLQMVKGWVGTDNQAHIKVFDVAGSATNGASVDTTTCALVGTGSDSLCTQWQDPEFDPQAMAFYYLRVVENPSCRWSWRLCLSLPEAQRPASCSDDTVAKTIQELAWTSPIWYTPS
jgi:hypothetical protein